MMILDSGLLFFGPPCIWHATIKLYEKSTIFHGAQCLSLPLYFTNYTTALQKLHSWINWHL